MTSILAVSGSPSVNSRTELLVEHAVERLSVTGFDTGHLKVRELPAAELLSGRSDSSALRAAAEQVAAADGLIVATPVYKASYTGLLKAFLDLLPQSGLAGKTVLPLATGGSLAHVLTIDYALRPVLTALGARHVVAGSFLLDSHVERLAEGGAQLRPEAELRLFDVVDEFIQALPAQYPTPAPGAATSATRSH
ncbi:NADPH-dependent FMN reductase [Streptomyces sp. NBC_01142]|uniref:NADPH-dependent FMN reductase n=1 Tax=Streptomyces sp. NBC_01142 TaxID=2975865 RepID=UPI002252318F|nr:NADPH-dependent FMN reductase [Streptomyces sp. NBC_01142]MCX4825387.1 NADPH-dependent FMN reductase [Streptomyces sp. NBC_01142]